MPRKRPQNPRRNPQRKPTQGRRPQQSKRPQNIKGSLPGSLTAYSEGNKHENGGIKVPEHNAEVEKGETKVGSYVFSDASDMKLTKTLAKENGIDPKYAGKTFADVSKDIQKKYDKRENDPYTKNAMDREIEDLRKAQESKKAEKVKEAIKTIEENTDQDIIPDKVEEQFKNGVDSGDKKAYGGELGDPDDDTMPRYDYPLSEEYLNYEEGQRSVPIYRKDVLQGSYEDKSGQTARDLDIPQEEVQRRLRNRSNYTEFNFGGNMDKYRSTQNPNVDTNYNTKPTAPETSTANSGSGMGAAGYAALGTGAATAVQAGAKDEDAGVDYSEVPESKKEEIKKQKDLQQKQKVRSGVTSGLSAINPLLGAAFGVGSKLGDTVAGKDRTIDEADTTGERFQKSAGSTHLDPFGSLVQYNQENGPVKGTGKYLVESNTFGLVNPEKVFKSGGDMEYGSGGYTEYQTGGGTDENGVVTDEEGNVVGVMDEEGNIVDSSTDTSSRAMTPEEESEDRTYRDISQMTPEERTEYLRRFGGEDEPLPTELQRQVAEMRRNPNSQTTSPRSNPYRKDAEFDNELSSLQKVAPFIKPAVGAMTMIGGPEKADYRRVDPDKVDYEEARDMARRQAALSRARAEESVRKNANTAGQALQGNISANIASQRNLNKALMKSRMQERNKNVGIMNRADRLNAEIAREEAKTDAKNRAIFDQNLTNIAGDVGRGIQGVAKDQDRHQAQNQYNRAYIDALNNRYRNYRYDISEDEEGKKRFDAEFQKGNR